VGNALFTTVGLLDRLRPKIIGKVRDIYDLGAKIFEGTKRVTGDKK
jgi:hypothetical protein